MAEGVFPGGVIDGGLHQAVDHRCGGDRGRAFCPDQNFMVKIAKGGGAHADGAAGFSQTPAKMTGLEPVGDHHPNGRERPFGRKRADAGDASFSFPGGGRGNQQLDRHKQKYTFVSPSRPEAPTATLRNREKIKTKMSKFSCMTSFRNSLLLT